MKVKLVYCERLSRTITTVLFVQLRSLAELLLYRYDIIITTVTILTHNNITIIYMYAIIVSYRS